MPSRKLGCLECRKRHVRCDSVRPSCNTCRTAKDGRQCSYVSLDIRPARYVKRFGRQTLDTSAVRSPGAPPRVDVRRPASQSDRLRCFNAASPTVPDDNSVLGPSRDNAGPVLEPRRASVLGTTRSDHGPVTDPVEAELFEFYIKEAGYYLDIVSPERHLSRAAPMLALTDRLLYSACLAYSSHLLYLLGRFDKVSEQRFNDNAIQLLIQKLSEDPDTWSEGSVLTTTVLMRVTEQLAEIAEDGEYHLNGAFSVTASAGRTWMLEPRDLETSAFWTYLRMSVRMCFLCEHATKCDPIALVKISGSNIGLATSVWSEAALTNRMTYLLAKICNACWPSSGRISEVELLRLRAELHNLKEILPSTFQPWSSISRSGSLHSTVRYMSTWHAIFWQFLHAANVLLAANFALLSPSPTIASQGQYLEREIVAPTRKLLAVAFSSDEIGSRINAAALVGWCGQFLTQPEEQDAVITWLAKLSADAAWPSKTVTGRLKRIWAGEQSHWTADPVIDSR